MEKNIKVVTVEENDMRELEKAFMLYNASTDIINHMMGSTTIDKELFNEYFTIAESRYINCEMIKTKLANKYKTPEIDLNKYDYSFDFRENTLTFKEA